MDTLDKCKQEKNIKAIFQLFAQTRNIKPILLQIFVMSKPELPIHFGFKQISDKTYQNVLFYKI